MKPQFFSDKFKRWKEAVHNGVEQVIKEIEDKSKARLRQQKKKEEEKRTEDVSNSWYHDDNTDKSIHAFGYEHPDVNYIEYGEFLEQQETEPRPFITPTVQEYVGNTSAKIIIKSVEESGLDERI